MKPHWKIDPPDPDVVARLRRTLPCHPVTATVLASRGFNGPEDAGLFLSPSLSNLRPPFPMKDMTTAVERIARALRRREKIAVFHR